MAYKCFYIFTFVFLSLACYSEVEGRSLAKHKHIVHSKNYQNETYQGGRISPSINESILAANFLGPQKEDPKYVRHWAVYYTNKMAGPFYGAKVQLNVYGLSNTKSDQLSSSSVWVQSGLSGPSTKFNSIQAGWIVDPALYHDYDSHFFIYWTADGYESTGCFDLLCKGFVLDNSTKLKPGNRLTPVSEYNGAQRYFTLRIQKNFKTGDWWLYRDDGDDAGPVGYWPKSLFTSLANSASNVQWGGFVRSLKGESGPPMGSGHFSSEGEGKAAYLKNIKVVNSIGDIYTVIKNIVVSYVDRPDCYNVGEYKDSNGSGGSDGYGFFLFGGPGCTN